MKYRPEIDGLRAVAVASVVLAHAGVPLVQGGFIGVDVFFVISGYLITSLILEDRDKGRFRLSTFYFRRARRILPALFVVLIACLPFAWWLLLPSQFIEFGRSMAAAALFLSNAYFWEKTGYFETSADLLPLLHTWSLAVEEQYYLLFPLLCMAVLRFAPRFFPYLLFVLGALSISLAQWGAVHLPDQNFFFTFSRFWEIFLGAFCAVLPRPNAKQWHAGAALAGLGLILIAAFGFSKATPTPSLITLVPTGGAALVLMFGGQAGLAKRVLTLPMMTGLGAISYSVYLWHQPAFVFARIYYVTGVPTAVMGGLILLVLALAYLSWRFVEQPFRHNAALTKSRVFLLSGMGIAACVTAGLWLHQTDLSRYRYSETDLKLLNYDTYYRQLNQEAETTKRLIACFGDSNGYLPDLDQCFPASAPSAPLIWGDSHAQALASGWLFVRDTPVALAFDAGCPPVIGVSFPNNPDCEVLNDAILAKVSQTKPTSIYLHANWTLYLEQKRHIFASEDDLSQAIRSTITAIKAASPQSRITVVGGVPQWGDGLPTYLYRLGLGLNGTYRLAPPEADGIRHINTLLKTIAADADIAFVDPFDILCNPDGCLATIEQDGQYFPTAWDYGHMTAQGASLIASRLN